MQTDILFSSRRAGSDVPSYHSAEHRSEPVPAYTRHAAGAGPDQSRTESSASQRPQQQQEQQQRTIGLPPLPPLASGMGTLNIHNYRLPTWSTRNAPAERQYNSVIERRARAEKERQKAARKSGGVGGVGVVGRPRAATLDRTFEYSSSSVHRPLEDPYLVGEQAAAQARRERLSRETGDDILIREDQQWDWLLGKCIAGLPFRPALLHRSLANRSV